MIGNAHIDPVWLWRWQEGYQEVRATFWSAIHRMTEYPEFVFSCDSVGYLEWVEESDPALFAEIRARIADGRWQVFGGWWIEPDCNLPGGESFVRQALYAQRYLAEKFGVIATVGGNVDPFGHHAMLPQLLRKAGMDSYVFLRPGPHELALPGPHFWWESPDGSRVLAYRIPHEYCSPGQDLGGHLDKALAQLPAGEPELMVFYGVGNHGGGPTKANLDSIRRLDELGAFGRLRCGGPREYFDRLAAVAGDRLATHAGELQHHGVGCYSAHSGVKRWNRRAENALLDAEKWAAVARAVTGTPYPGGELTGAWKQVLFNQFHDILAGTAIESAYDDARDQLGEATAVAARVANRSRQALSQRIDLPQEPGGTPLVVFNPHPWPVRADVELEFGGHAAHAGEWVADADGSAVPVQRTRSEATVDGWRRRIVLDAELPPLGYRTYRVQAGAGHAFPLPAATDLMLENPYLRVVVDPATGWLSSLLDRTTGTELMPARPGPHAVVLDDQSDTWGHRVLAYDRRLGAFECRRVRLVEHGPVRSVLRIESAYGASTLVEELVLGAHSRHLEVRVRLDWRERLAMLKLRFPTALAAATATYEIPYGHLERPADGAEEPGQAWVDVSAGGAGLSLLNDGKYGFDVRGGEIGMTVARSPVYAWHEPKRLDDDGLYEYLDQGVQRFNYRLLPHAGDWRAAGTVRAAAELNQPPVPLLETYHPGPLPLSASYLDAGSGSVVVTVVKAGEDGDGDLVVRAYETAGEATVATLDVAVAGRRIEAEFGAYEVKTFRVPADPAAPVAEVDLLEWADGEGPARGTVGALQPAVAEPAG
jgi:alpha-mannosidase